MRRLLIILVGLVAMLAVGCGEGNGGVVLQDADLSCEVPDDIKSYRITMSVKMDIEGLEEALEEAEQTAEAGVEGAEDEPFAELGEALAPLMGGLLTGLTDMRVEGAFVAPDRSEVWMKFGELELSSITIGDNEWIKVGAGEWQKSGEQVDGWTVTTEGSDLGDLCEGFAFPELSGLEAREETVNGVATYHYHLDEPDISDLAQFFDEDLFEETEDVEGVLQEGVLDLWLAKEGNWPVRMEGEFSFTDEEGTEISASFLMEVKDLNDPDIKIEPPTG